MATKRKTAEAEQEQTAVAAEDESQAAGAPEEEAHGEQTAQTGETQETPAAAENAVAAQTLESLSALATRHRVPAWRQAALCRFMGWVDGKMLTDDDYTAALAKLDARHLGGGRRK